MFDMVLNVKALVFLKRSVDIEYHNFLKLTSHRILHYSWSADLSKSFSQLIMAIFIFFQYFFFNRFCPVERCGVTPHCVYHDSLTLSLRYFTNAINA